MAPPSRRRREHGRERYVPVDFGVPTDVRASSPTAPDAPTCNVGAFGTTCGCTLAADAAFGALTAPGAHAPAGTATTASVSRVADRRLAELATVESAPPAGLQPWEGAVLLAEAIGDATVSAWFSGLAGQGIIDLEQQGRRTIRLVVTVGWRQPRRAPR